VECVQPCCGSTELAEVRSALRAPGRFACARPSKAKRQHGCTHSTRSCRYVGVVAGRKGRTPDNFHRISGGVKRHARLLRKSVRCSTFRLAKQRTLKRELRAFFIEFLGGTKCHEGSLAKARSRLFLATSRLGESSLLRWVLFSYCAQGSRLLVLEVGFFCVRMMSPPETVPLVES